jgi:hypothetical protein
LELLEDRTLPSALVALTDSGHLLTFDSSAPGTIQANAVITGTHNGDRILSIAVRPSNQQLYAVSFAN